MGSFPSQPNCSFSLCFSLYQPERKILLVLGQAGQTWALLQPRLFRFVFDFNHSEQTSSSNQRVNDGLAVSLAFAASLSYTLLLAAGSKRKSFPSSRPLPSSPLIIPLLLLPTYFLLSALAVILHTPVGSSPLLPPYSTNLNVNVTAAPSNCPPPAESCCQLLRLFTQPLFVSCSLFVSH